MDITQEGCYTTSRRVPFEELTIADDFMKKFAKNS